MYLIDFFETYYRPQRLLGKSENTNRLYRMSISSFGKTVITKPTLADLTDANVIKHMQRLLDNGRSPATANKDRSQLLTLWRHAHRLKLVDSWPNVVEKTSSSETRLGGFGSSVFPAGVHHHRPRGHCAANCVRFL